MSTKWFRLKVWSNGLGRVFETTMENGDRQNGCYTRAEADDWADYFRGCGFGCVLILMSE